MTRDARCLFSVQDMLGRKLGVLAQPVRDVLLRRSDRIGKLALVFAARLVSAP